MDLDALLTTTQAARAVNVTRQRIYERSAPHHGPPNDQARVSPGDDGDD